MMTRRDLCIDRKLSVDKNNCQENNLASPPADWAWTRIIFPI